MTAALYQGYHFFTGPAVLARRSLLVARSAEGRPSLEDGRKMRVFDGSYDEEICCEVVATAKTAIRSKGSFSIDIPSGSDVKAVGKLSQDAVDYSKFHIFFTNDRSYPDGVKLANALDIPESQGCSGQHGLHACGEEGHWFFWREKVSDNGGQSLEEHFWQFDCPTGMVSACETIWFRDTDSFAAYKA
ncbi:unnamed protein product [Polarella glacialis]|uniref:Uncharacterized protein n=1 Tax=Polarella glacialis TaxID=89957 RepID=A0A813DUI3_POLGL|nr:unnamed protein product [Polarella glacialis]CAE8724837.1 unnamed protein product [Polarella glacialis]